MSIESDFLSVNTGLPIQRRRKRKGNRTALTVLVELYGFACLCGKINPLVGGA